MTDDKIVQERRIEFDSILDKDKEHGPVVEYGIKQGRGLGLERTEQVLRRAVIIIMVHQIAAPLTHRQDCTIP